MSIQNKKTVPFVRKPYGVRAAVFSSAWIITACGGASSVAPAPIDSFKYAQSDRIADATAHYGPLSVRAGDTGIAASDVTPWVGYWLQDASDYLYQGQDDKPAPLEKYDLYMKEVHDQSTSAADTERNRIDREMVAGSVGHCDAWALASIVVPEPAHGAKVAGIVFSVGDLKSLIVDSYEQNNMTKSYGQPYEGPSDDFADIYPDQFQRVVQAEIFEKHRALIMDKDPGVEVWNTPIFRAEFNVVADPTDQEVMHVTAYVMTASAVKENNVFATMDSVGFNPHYDVWISYTYDLYGKAQSDGSFLVKSSQWTGNSVTDHPDFVTVVDDSAPKTHTSDNDQVDTDSVNEIVQAAALAPVVPSDLVPDSNIPSP